MNDGPPESFSVSVKPGLNDPLSIEQVEDILAPDGLFFGAEAVKRLVGVSLSPDLLESIRPKTYTHKRALLAKEHGRAVTLHIPTTPLHLRRFFLKNRRGDIFAFDPNGEIEKELYIFLRNYREKTALEWREVSHQPVPGTVGGNLLTCLNSLALYIADTTYAPESLPPVYIHALGEYDRISPVLEAAFTDDLCNLPDGHTFIDHVSRLGLTRLCIPTFAQLFYTMALCRASKTPFPTDLPLATATLHASLSHLSPQILSLSQATNGIPPLLTSPLGLPRGAGVAFSQKII